MEALCLARSVRRRLLGAVAPTLAALLFALAPGASWAVPIDALNGATQIQVTSFGTLTDAGVTVAPGGTGQLVVVPALPSPFVFYDITSVDEDSGEIFHVGSLLDLSSSGVTVSLSDFIIDAGTGFVRADVFSPSFDLDEADVFSISAVCTLADPCIGLDGTTTIEGLELSLTAAAAGVLEQELGIPNLTGAPVGVASSTYTLVPEPGTASLLALGLLGLGSASRPRRPRSG